MLKIISEDVIDVTNIDIKNTTSSFKKRSVIKDEVKNTTYEVFWIVVSN